MGGETVRPVELKRTQGRTAVRVLQEIIGQQAVMIARLTEVVECTIPALRLELAEAQAVIETLRPKPPADPTTE